ncbi:mitochondrial resolvase Ydc2 [Xylaria palmicola]|nr:mitochondrial resolvase Ydc2 [Xylaria palmicola]
MTSASLGVIPRSLRAEQLKRLSFLCGLPVSGRKEELTSRLAVAAAAAAASNASLPSQSRSVPVVLSIDLGIRNLAYSLLTPVSPPAPLSGKTGVKAKKKRGGVPPSPSCVGTGPPAITLHAWQRLSLLEGHAAPPAQGGDVEALLHMDAAESVFAPAALAKTANAFLRDTLLRLDPLPTHILIERQRWRSGGAPAIQEWTVRVNTLEAMLHASLRTLRDVGVWSGDVMSIRPERVGQLFLDAGRPGSGAAVRKQGLEAGGVDASVHAPGKRTTRRKTGAETKKMKIELLGGWLGQGDLVVRPGNVGTGHMLDAYRDAVSGTKRTRAKRTADNNDTGEKLMALGTKLDDLTDSLLQGMAWLRWHENMALLQRPGGVEQLLG